MLALFISLIMSGTQPAQATGFSAGDYFESQRINGHLTVFCGGNGGIAYYDCSMEILNPGEYDYFVGPQGINADKVELTAVREDGSSKTKSGKYDSEKGRSKDHFNLWISSLTQKPLLDLGNNKVSYKMTKSGNTVTQGEFSVQVKRVPPATCRPGSYSSLNPSDCQGTANYACSRYFEDENYCQ